MRNSIEFIPICNRLACPNIFSVITIFDPIRSVFRFYYNKQAITCCGSESDSVGSKYRILSKYDIIRLMSTRMDNTIISAFHLYNLVKVTSSYYYSTKLVSISFASSPTHFLKHFYIITQATKRVRWTDRHRANL